MDIIDDIVRSTIKMYAKQLIDNMERDDGGTAFPLPVQNGEVDYEGMTLRDYFAAKAMSAMITTAACPCLTGLDSVRFETAKGAHEIADAMLQERSK